MEPRERRPPARCSPSASLRPSHLHFTRNKLGMLDGTFFLKAEAGGAGRAVLPLGFAWRSPGGRFCWLVLVGLVGFLVVFFNHNISRASRWGLSPGATGCFEQYPPRYQIHPLFSLPMRRNPRVLTTPSLPRSLPGFLGPKPAPRPLLSVQLLPGRISPLPVASSGLKGIVQDTNFLRTPVFLLFFEKR